MVPELKVPIDRCGATALMSEQRTLYWSDLSFDAVSPEIPYKLNIRQFVCTILSINKTRAKDERFENHFEKETGRLWRESAFFVFI